MKARKPTAIGLAATALVMVVAGALRLAQRLEPSCEPACVVTTTYRGGILVIGGLLAAALGMLAWPSDTSARL